jgi:hypothetical protein
MPILKPWRPAAFPVLAKFLKGILHFDCGDDSVILMLQILNWHAEYDHYSITSEFIAHSPIVLNDLDHLFEERTH